MVKPKHSFRAVVSQLVHGLENGDIVLEPAPEGLSISAPIIQHVQMRGSFTVDVSVPEVVYPPIHCSDQFLSSGVH